MLLTIVGKCKRGTSSIAFVEDKRANVACYLICLNIGSYKSEKLLSGGKANERLHAANLIIRYDIY